MQSRDTEQEGSGGRDRAGSFSARPRRLLKGLYSHTGRGREMHRLCLSTHRVPCLQSSTLHRARSPSPPQHSLFFSPPSHTSVQTQTHHCHVESRPEGDTYLHRTTSSQVRFIRPSIHSLFHSLVPAQTATLCTSRF